MHAVYLRDASLKRQAEIDDYQSLTIVVRFNAVGAWVLDLPYSDASGLVAGAGIEVVSDGVVLLSGPLVGSERKWGANGDSLTAFGVDDNVWLNRRLASPVPTGPPYSAAAYDLRTGVAETILRQFVDVNAGPSATTARRVPGLALAADQARGSTVTGRGRFQPLLELLGEIAAKDGLGFKVVSTGSGLEFQVYQPTDKTASVIFSAELGNLTGFTYRQEGAEANYVIAGGGGEGTARTFAEFGDSASVVKYGRIERFKDQRHTSVAEELQLAILEELLAAAEKQGLSLAPIDTESMRFVADYGLGDKVTAIAGSERIQDIIREVSITISPEGFVAKPLVGTPGLRQEGELQMFQRLAALDERLISLERR